VAAVRTFEADVVVVVESWRTPDGRGMLDDLETFGYHVESLNLSTLAISPRRARHAVPGEGHVEIAICSRLPIVAREELPIGLIPHDPYGPRSALMCTIDVDGTMVDVVAVHTSSMLWRLAPLRHLRALRPQLPSQERAVVVAGDCNFWGPGVVAVLPGWRRAVLGRSWPAHRPHSQIDHILVRDDVTVLSGEVLAATPSDHRPVRARLRVGPGPNPGATGTVG
jgi:endonuclease/exonuclease/phosphatase family metal-dependent hydrolase